LRAVESDDGGILRGVGGEVKLTCKEGPLLSPPIEMSPWPNLPLRQNTNRHLDGKLAQTDANPLPLAIENLRVLLGIDWSGAVEQLEENILIVAITGEAD